MNSIHTSEFHISISYTNTYLNEEISHVPYNLPEITLLKCLDPPVGIDSFLADLPILMEEKREGLLKENNC